MSRQLATSCLYGLLITGIIAKKYPPTASQCGWIPCDCAEPSKLVKHWHPVGSDSGFLPCGDILGDGYKSVDPGYWDESGLMATWKCCKDTDQAYDIYQAWLAKNPTATTECDAATQRMICLKEFPPCRTSVTDYAIFPCDDVKTSYSSVCGKPTADTLFAQFEGWGENRARCYDNDLVTFEHPANTCPFADVTCKHGGKYMPECTHCDCSKGWGGADCSSCVSDESCRVIDPNAKCVNSTGTQFSIQTPLSCTIKDAFLYSFVGDVPLRGMLDVPSGNGSFIVSGVALGKGPDWFQCTFNGCRLKRDDATDQSCSDYSVPSPCVACDSTSCDLLPTSGRFTRDDVKEMLTALTKTSYFGCESDGSTCSLSLSQLLNVPLLCNTGQCSSTGFYPISSPSVSGHSSGYAARVTLILFAVLAPLAVLAWLVISSLKLKSSPMTSKHSVGDEVNIPLVQLMGESAGITADREMVALNPVSPSHQPALSTKGHRSLEFNDLSCKIGLKTVVKNASGVCLSGKVTAILGPSGAGKTSLIDILAGRKNVGVVVGSVSLGNVVCSPAQLRRRVSYVYQDDRTLVATMTVREALTFRVRLKKNVSEGKAREMVDEVLGRLSLTHVSDSLIGGGSNMVRGISGGEKKRVAIAVELIAEPDVLILDEPTSGLDSGSAKHVMETIHSIAKTTDCTVVLSIHQPRYDIFRKLDKVVLLGVGGSVLFSGDPASAVSAFEGLTGSKVPFGINPADFVLDAMQYLRNSDIEKLQSIKRANESDQCVAEAPSASAGKDLPEGRSNSGSVSPSPPSFFLQCYYLSLRELRNLVRNPLLLLLHVGANIVVGLMVGFMFRGVTLDNSGVQNRAGMLFFTEAFLGLLSISSLGIWREERLVVVRESIAGYYHRYVYFSIKCFWDAVLLRVLPTVLYCFIVYWMVGLHDRGMESYPTEFLLFTLICIGVSVSCTAVCQLISSLIPSESAGTMVTVLLLLLQLVFGGFLINKKNTPSYLQWIQFISLFNYANEALMVNEFIGLNFLFQPEGFNVALQLSGETWLDQFFFKAANFTIDVWAVYIIAVVFYILSGLAVTYFVTERR